MADLSPPPVPTDDQLARATEELTNMTECKALDGWVATFRREDLSCTGVWPADHDLGSLREFEVPVEALVLDRQDMDGCWARALRRSALGIRQGIERHDLELEMMREALAQRFGEYEGAMV